MAKKTKTRKFVVRKGRNIFVEGPDGKSLKVLAGTVLSMTAKEAKHFHGHGCLDPYMEDFDDAEETETEADEEAEGVLSDGL